MQTPSPNLPNLLLITTDQQRWDFYDNRHVPSLRTPGLTRLRREGATLTHAFSNCPICMPTRFTWCHGLYASQAANGLMQNWHAWPRFLPSMPLRLQQAGYHTALIGKLHAQGRWHNDLTTPKFVAEVRERGFEDVFEVCGKSFALKVDCHWTHHLRRRGLLERYRADLLRRQADTGGDDPADPTFLPTDDTADAFIGRHVRDWLAGRDDRRPFFLHASFCGPHFPIDPPAEYHARYRPADVPPPAGVDDPDRIAYWQKRTAAYCAMIEHVDHEIGTVLDLLDAQGLAANTLVLFATDHGDMTGHHDRAHKGPFYDTSCRTPYLLRWPGRIPAGIELDGMIEAVDLPATILDAAGLGTDTATLLDSSPGRSFLAYAMGGAQPPRDWAYAENGPQNHGGWRMCREKDWKYVWSPEGEWLFDMCSDPWEKNNLVDNPAQAARRSRMRVQLIASMQKIVAPSRWRIGQSTYDEQGAYLPSSVGAEGNAPAHGDRLA